VVVLATKVAPAAVASSTVSKELFILENGVVDVFLSTPVKGENCPPVIP